jgi:hypothetical protein
MVAGFAGTGLSKSVMLVALRRTRMTRRKFTALLCCALMFVGAPTYSPGCALAKDSDRGGSDRGGGGDRSDSGGGNSDGGRGNSDGGRGNSGNEGNSGGGRGGGGGRGEGGQSGGGSQGAGRGEGNQGGEGRGGPPGAGAAGGRSNSGVRGSATAPGGWGTTSPERAREAVSHGWALPLGSVLPTVASTVPGQVLEVDLRQTWAGDWIYDFLILTQDRRYREVMVDARTNQVLQVRRR